MKSIAVPILGVSAWMLISPGTICQRHSMDNKVDGTLAESCSVLPILHHPEAFKPGAMLDLFILTVFIGWFYCLNMGCELPWLSKRETIYTCFKINCLWNYPQFQTQFAMHCGGLIFRKQVTPGIGKEVVKDETSGAPEINFVSQQVETGGGYQVSTTKPPWQLCNYWKDWEEGRISV